MSNVTKYYEEINRYNSLKSKLSNIVSELRKASANILNAPDELTKVYSYNSGGTLLSGKIKILSNDMTETSNHINNVVIPAIDSAIYKLKRKIAEEKEKELMQVF